MARYYEINGQLYTSVTTALSVIRKPLLETWRGDLGNEEADRLRDEAAVLGRQIHACCHEVVKGGLAYPHPLVDAFEEWFQATVKEVILAETPTWHDLYRYAGTPDLVAVLKGDRAVPTMIDIKTTGAIWPDMGLQLAAYQEALKTHGIKTKRRLIVHLDKKAANPVARVKEFNDEQDFNMFLYALSLYNYFNGGVLNGRKDCDVIKVS